MPAPVPTPVWSLPPLQLPIHPPTSTFASKTGNPGQCHQKQAKAQQYQTVPNSTSVATPTTLNLITPPTAPLSRVIHPEAAVIAQPEDNTPPSVVNCQQSITNQHKQQLCELQQIDNISTANPLPSIWHCHHTCYQQQMTNSAPYLPSYQMNAVLGPTTGVTQTCHKHQQPRCQCMAQQQCKKMWLLGPRL